MGARCGVLEVIDKSPAQFSREKADIRSANGELKLCGWAVPAWLQRSTLGDGSLPIVYPASVGHELDQTQLNSPPGKIHIYSP